jgi:hypothetical protein
LAINLRALTSVNMKILQTLELERLVRETFPQKAVFSAVAELDGKISWPIVAHVHGGPDPFLDRHFDAWLAGARRYVSAYQVMNRLCRAGALAPGEYGLTPSPAAPS